MAAPPAPSPAAGCHQEPVGSAQRCRHSAAEAQSCFCSPRCFSSQTSPFLTARPCTDYLISAGKKKQFRPLSSAQVTRRLVMCLHLGDGPGGSTAEPQRANNDRRATAPAGTPPGSPRGGRTRARERFVAGASLHFPFESLSTLTGSSHGQCFRQFLRGFCSQPPWEAGAGLDGGALLLAAPSPGQRQPGLTVGSFLVLSLSQKQRRPQENHLSPGLPPL